MATIVRKTVRKTASAALGLALIASIGIGPISPVIAAPVAIPAADIASSSIDEINKQQIIDVFNGINKFRAEKGLAPVKFNVTVSEMAEDWSDQMAAAKMFGHNPNYWTDPRIFDGRRAGGEIVAARWDEVGQGLVDQWINSPGHNAIMSDPDYEYIGIGITKTGNIDFRKEPRLYTMFGTVNFFTWDKYSTPAGAYQTPEEFFEGLPEIPATPLPTVVESVAPTFDEKTHEYVIPSVEGLEYFVNGKPAVPGKTHHGPGLVEVTVQAKEGYQRSGRVFWEFFFDWVFTPPAPTFDTIAGTYTIPSRTGVEYYVNGTKTAAGTYDSGWTTISVTAQPVNGHILSGDIAWEKNFVQAVGVTPLAPGFNNSTGTYTIPAKTGISYLVNGETKAAGTYNSGWKKITVTAKASAGYVLAGGTTSWSNTFIKPEPPTQTVSAATPSFQAEDFRYTIPAVPGVQYYVNGTAKSTGTYPAGTGKLTITAQAISGYELSGTAMWSHTFTAKPNPSIKSEGEIVAADSRGRLWNYGKSGAGATRKNIGSSGWSSMDEIHTVDWNSDGYIDIIAKSKTGQLYFYKARPTGGFIRYTLGSSGWRPYDLTVTDWNGTGKHPVVIAKNARTGQLFVYGNATGYKLSPRYILGGSGWSKLTLTAMDWDKDGRKDLVARTSSGQLKLYRGNASGKFVNESRKVIGRSGWNTMTSLTSSNGLGGIGTTGLIAKDRAGKLWYYQSNKNSFASRKLIGTGWSSYNIAGQ